jgi:hypothetical protein
MICLFKIWLRYYPLIKTSFLLKIVRIAPSLRNNLIEKIYFAKELYFSPDIFFTTTFFSLTAYAKAIFTFIICHNELDLRVCANPGWEYCA